MDDDSQEISKRRVKRMKYEILENWGIGEEEQSTDIANTTSKKMTSEVGDERRGIRNHQESLCGEHGRRSDDPATTTTPKELEAGDSTTIPQTGEGKPPRSHYMGEI